MSSADDPLTGAAGSSHDERSGLRARIAGQAEDAIGKLADDLLENPVFNSAISSAFAARERMAQAQQSAMGALNLPSASDLDKLARRLRSISQRLEEVEDGVDTVGTKLDSLSEAAERPARDVTERLDRIEARVDQLAVDVAALRREASSPGGLAGEPPAIVPEG